MRPNRYGVKVGLKNYAAAYCTGLLLARRVLTKVGLADAFKGVEEVTAEEFHVEDDYDGDRRPFKAVLDVRPAHLPKFGRQGKQARKAGKEGRQGRHSRKDARGRSG